MFFLSNTVSVTDSGLLEGFCDYHCHLLPGVDDGVKDMHETIHILERLEQLGVSHVWLTPHIMEDYPNQPAQLKQRFDLLVSQFATLHASRSALTLHLAAENMLDGLFVERLKDNDLLTITTDSSTSLLLIETSYYIPPMNMENLIDRIKEKDFKPLLAHPERYQYMRNDDYRRWKQKGVLLQLNVPSLVGAYGVEAQHKAEWLLNQGMYDCCGTDIHSISHLDYFLSGMIKKKTIRQLHGLPQF